MVKDIRRKAASLILTALLEVPFCMPLVTFKSQQKPVLISGLDYLQKLTLPMWDIDPI